MKGGAKVFAPRAAKVANSNEVENFKDWGIAQVYLKKKKTQRSTRKFEIKKSSHQAGWRLASHIFSADFANRF